VDVTFFLTYVGLDISIGLNDQILQNLAPLREVFDVEELEFDELMQRDIDDARVSEELIPYLLDARTRQLVKFFPPIVVMVLPTMMADVPQTTIQRCHGRWNQFPDRITTCP
jgi:hypothetical protein